MYLILGTILFGVVLVLLREAWLHVILAGVAQAFLQRGDVDRARKLLERIVRLPSLFGSACAPDERYRLAWCYLSAGRPQDAIAECRTILARRRSPTVEATIRRRLADALEAAGETAAAEEERKRAEQCLETGARDLDYYLVQARTLSDQRRYAEACESYRKAIELIPRGNGTLVAETMVRLSLTCFQAGLHAEAVTWAESALALDPAPHLRASAHSAAAIGSSSQGLLDAAERHHRLAYEAAAGTRDGGVRHLAAVADIQRRQGKLREAIRTCEEATSASLDAWRLAALCEAEALKSLGQFEQARAALARARRAKALAVPAEERRSQGTLALAMAHLEAESGQPAEAERWLEEARSGFTGDERLLLWCDALAAWIAALQGQAAGAEAALAHVVQRQAAFPDDHVLWELCTSMRARVHTTNGRYQEAYDAWREYLDGRVDLIDRPTALFHLGECLRHLGNPEGAREAYRQAVEFQIDSYDARRARQRLDELDVSSTAP